MPAFSRSRPALAALAIFALARTARAEPSSTEQADALFDEARALVRAGKYAAACPKFAESLRLDPAPGTRLNLAACEEKAGHLVRSLALLEQAAGELPADDARVALAKQRGQALRARIPRVVLPESTGAHLAENGVDLPGAAGVYLLDPGRHELSIVKDGRVVKSAVVTLAETDVQALGADGPAPPKPVAAAPAPSSDARRTAGIVVFGAGLAALGVGVVTGALALHDKSVVDDHCDASNVCRDQEGLDAKNHGRTAATLSTVFFIAGGAAAATGLVLFFTAPKHLGVAIVPGGVMLRGEL